MLRNVITRIDLRGRTLTRRELLEELPRAEVDVEHAAEVVAPILADVRARGAAELRDLAERFDGVRPVHLRVPAAAIAAAVDVLDPDVRAALEETIRRVREVHGAQRPADFTVELAPGAQVRQRWVPVRRVGLYVPGGLAVYPSSVVMNVVAAQAAGVGSLAVASPPQKDDDGLPDPVVLATCALLGVDEVYAVGGAQAIAMFAYGAAGSDDVDGETLCEPVDVVTGPGNVYVAAAKRLVRGIVGIDAEAGPTEIAILADGTADATHVAADLVSQAEHDPLAAAVLVTPSVELAGAVEAKLVDRVDATMHRGRVTTALERQAVGDRAGGRPGAGPRGGQRVRRGAPRDPDGRRRGARRAGDQRGRDLRRRVLAGLAGRLHGRLQPRAAHRRLRALHQRARRALVPARGPGDRVRRRRARRGRGQDRRARGRRGLPAHGEAVRARF